MSKPLPNELLYQRPWLERPSDVGLNGAPVFADDVGLKPYWLFFVLLRISPSYELARQAVEEADLSPTPITDFERVLTHTYALFGDVQSCFFTVWWRERAAAVFGSGQVKLLRPVDLDVDFRFVRALMGRITKDPKKARVRDVAAYLNPDDAYGKATTANHYVENDQERRDRLALATTFNRDVEKGKLLAENAARAFFPSVKPVESAPFDYALMGAQLTKTFDFEIERKTAVR